MSLADSQLYQLASFDPYTTMVQAPMQRKQAEIQAMETEQAYKEAQAEQAQQGLGQMAGQTGQPTTGLAQMAPSVFPPGVKLQTESGEPTVAGEFSQKLTPYLTSENSANKALKDATGIRRMAAGESDPTKRAGMLRQATEIESKARLETREATNGKQKVVDEFYGDLATRYVNAMNAPSQKDYDTEIENWNKNSGFGKFKDAPEKYGPETREKLKEYMKTLPPPLQEKIKEKLKAERKEKDAETKNKLEIDQLIAHQRNGWRPLKGSSDFESSPTSSPSAYVYSFTGTKLKDADAEKITTATNALGDAAGLKQMVEEHPEWAGRKGQVSQYVDKYIKSFRDGKGEPTIPKGLDQSALIFAKRYAEYLVNYERALAGGSRGFTVQFQKRFNDLMSGNQFNPEGFKSLMDEQSRSIRSGAISLSPGADAKKLNAMALDQKQRAEDDYAVRGLSGGKKLEDSNPKPNSGDAKSQAEAAIAAGAPRDAVAKKYKELTGKDL
jgi:hypothetical protein